MAVSKKDKETKKQIPLRLSQSLNDELTRWADEEFRSLNGQIEYLLSQAVLERKKSSKKSKKEEE